MDSVSGISAGAIVLDFDGKTWSEKADSARIFLSKYEDEIAETRRELQGTSKQTERRKLQGKIETLEKVLRNPCCTQAIFELPGCSIMYRDGEWGFYKPPQLPPTPTPPPPQQQPQLKFNLQESAFLKGLSSFHKKFVSVGNELTQTFAELVDSIPLSMEEMLEEAPIPAECRPARRLTDDLGAFIRGLPPSTPITKGDIFVLAEMLGCVLKLGMRPGKELWDWISSYGENRQYNTAAVAFTSFRKCVSTLATASAAFADKGEMFVKFVSCAIK